MPREQAPAPTMRTGIYSDKCRNQRDQGANEDEYTAKASNQQKPQDQQDDAPCGVADLSRSDQSYDPDNHADYCAGEDVQRRNPWREVQKTSKIPAKLENCLKNQYDSTDQEKQPSY